MFALVGKAIIVFLWGKKVIHQKQSVLSELKENYTDNQARTLMIAI